MATNADHEFDREDTTTNDIPQGGDTVDNSYSSRPGDIYIPVVKDEVPVEQPNEFTNPDSDEMLGMYRHRKKQHLTLKPAERDEADAIKKGSILKGGRTRRAAKPRGTYCELSWRGDSLNSYISHGAVLSMDWDFLTIFVSMNNILWLSS